MTPLTLLAACLLVTLTAAGIHAAGVVKRRIALRRLAAIADLHFAAGDRFNLAWRVAALLPITGVAAARVSNVLYGRRGHCYYYIFRVDYTVGAAARQRRRRAVAVLEEPHVPTGDGERTSDPRQAAVPVEFPRLRVVSMSGSGPAAYHAATALIPSAPGASEGQGAAHPE